jgi:hypothetical protein
MFGEDDTHTMKCIRRVLKEKLGTAFPPERDNTYRRMLYNMAYEKAAKECGIIPGMLRSPHRRVSRLLPEETEIMDAYNGEILKKAYAGYPERNTRDRTLLAEGAKGPVKGKRGRNTNNEDGNNLGEPPKLRPFEGGRRRRTRRRRASKKHTRRSSR